MADRTPLYDVVSKAGAVFVAGANWLMPARYGDAAAEYYSACHDAALFDVSHRGKVEAAGTDAASFLHNLTTNAIKGLPVGQGCEAFLTNAQAHIVAHALIYHMQLRDWPRPGERREAYWLDLAPGMADKVSAHFKHYLVTEQVEIHDRTRDLAALHLAGPQARVILERAMRGDLEGVTALQNVERTFKVPAGGVSGDPSVDPTVLIRLPPIATCHIRKHDMLGVPGYDILVPPNRAATVWQYLIAAGARPAGLQAYHIMRVEAGMPADGVDMDESNLAPEVGRTAQAISYTKGCYLGQEPIVRIRDLGHVNRTLLGVKVAGGQPVPRGSKLFQGEQEVGYVASSVVSPRTGGAIGLAYIRRGSQAAGTRLQVDAAGGRREVEVATLPFVLK